MQKFIKNVLWVIIGIILILVTISRLFIATHFPHQCLIGAIFGNCKNLLIFLPR